MGDDSRVARLRDIDPLEFSSGNRGDGGFSGACDFAWPGRGLGGSSAGFILSIGDGFINGPINNFGDACLGGEKANDENFGK